jgi:hypothetical protein
MAMAGECQFHHILTANRHPAAMASPNRIPPSVAALFAQRNVTPAREPAARADAAPPAERDFSQSLALAALPPRNLRRGSLLNILV